MSDYYTGSRRGDQELLERDEKPKTPWLRIDWRPSDYGCRTRDRYGNVKICCFPFEEI